MPKSLKQFLKLLVGAIRDLSPIVIVIVIFQTVIFRQPFPNLEAILIGLICVVLGLTLFVQGLEMGLFPLGEALSEAMTRKGSLVGLIAFAFVLGFGTTVAEPALIAIAAEAGEIAGQAGAIENSPESKTDYSFWLRMTVALSVGCALVVGVFRILVGWPIQYFIIGGYIIVVIMTNFAPPEIVGIAYDSGGVTTSTITVPLVTALGVGMASTIRGRNPMLDGFGLIAFASLSPMIFVMIFGIVF